MARVAVSENTGGPYCTGCGEEMYWLPGSLDSRPKRTLAREVVAFAMEHADCPDRETREMTASGVTGIVQQKDTWL